MCVKLIYCIINSSYRLKAALAFVLYVLWPGYLLKTDFTIFHDLQLPLCWFNLFEIWWGHSWILCSVCLQKSVRIFSVLLLLLFMKLFLLQLKTKNELKDINRHFTSNKLNNKDIRTSFCKKANLWTFNALTDFIWNFYGK